MSADDADSVRTELVVVSAADDAALVAEAARLVEFLDRVPEVELRDVAYTASLSRGPARLAIVASSVRDLHDRLLSAKTRLASGTVARMKDKSGTYYFRERLVGEGRGRLAYVYPGVASFHPGMLRDLAVAFPECRRAFDDLESAMADEPDFSPSDYVFPPADRYRRDADIFRSGAYAQALVATFAASDALTRLLSATGLRPDGVVGCTGGDLAAVMRSGAAGEEMSRADHLRAVRDIYRIVGKALSGGGGIGKCAMIAVFSRRAEEADAVAASFPPESAALAVDLSPRQRTYAVSEEFAEEAIRRFASAGVRTLRLPLDRPFNTPKCERLVPAVRKFADAWMRNTFTCDVYSCALAAPLERDRTRAARKDTAERWSRQVRFTETVRRMHDDGYRVFLEVGPQGIMTTAVDDILSDREHAAIALNSIHRSGILQLQHALAQLAALGAEMDLSALFADRAVRRLDFDSALSLEVRRAAELRLSRSFPRLMLLGEEKLLGAEFLAEPKGRGLKAAARAAAVRESRRRQRQFDFGAMHPLVSDAEELESTPGVSYAVAKTFRLSDAPFLGDSAYGASQLSYTDFNLKGFLTLSLAAGAEIMAETALRVMPGRKLVAVEELVSRYAIEFEKGCLPVKIRAERVAPADPATAAVKVQIWLDKPDADFTWPAMEATFVLAAEELPSVPAAVEPLFRPRSIHWSGREIYPAKLGYGKRLRGIVRADIWGEEGLDYQVETPSSADCVIHTRFPVWSIDPLLLQVVASGFQLWRSHEKFAGSFSCPFKMGRLTLRGVRPKEGSILNCYLRLTGVGPVSLKCDVAVTGGDGNVLMEIAGWEEYVERVPQSYCSMVLQPAVTFLTESFSKDFLGGPATSVASAYFTDVPYPIFERHDGLWLKILGDIALDSRERRKFAEMGGSRSRKVEWLFGRIAAKEAVRKFLRDCYQARWSYADVEIWPDESGKPQLVGEWKKFLSTRLDVAIAHTSKFVIAVAAANYRVGVDVESVMRNLSEEFAVGVFAPEERGLAADAPNSVQALIRFWCAKEAVSKALGVGIRYSPKEMTVIAFEPDTGRLAVRLTGAWAEAYPVFRGRDITVATRVMRDHALAFCFIPSTFFPDDEDDF